MKTIGYTAVTLIVSTYTTILSGWVFSKLWLWFVVSTFSMQPIGISASIGLGMVISYLTHQHDGKKDERSFGEILMFGFIWGTMRPIIAIITGWVVKQCL